VLILVHCLQTLAKTTQTLDHIVILGKESDMDGDSECTFGVFQMYTTYLIIGLFMIGVNIGSLFANFGKNYANFGSYSNPVKRVGRGQ
jgi:hypothetical protein